MMTSGNGVVAATAVEILATLDYPRTKLAARVGCHPRTVRRWENGEHQPSRRNRTALRALIGELLMVEYAGPETARAKSRIKWLNRAAESLMTVGEKFAAKAERDDITARLRASQAAAEQRRQQEEAEKHADVRALVAEQRQGRHDRIAAAVAAAQQPEPHIPMVARLADPFDAFTPDREMAAVEAVFG